MNYFLLAETDFFRLINEAGDCNMETAYTAFATQVIELCNGGMDMNLTGHCPKFCVNGSRIQL